MRKNSVQLNKGMSQSQWPEGKRLVKRRERGRSVTNTSAGTSELALYSMEDGIPGGVSIEKGPPEIPVFKGFLQLVKTHQGKDSKQETESSQAGIQPVQGS